MDTIAIISEPKADEADEPAEESQEEFLSKSIESFCGDFPQTARLLRSMRAENERGERAVLGSVFELMSVSLRLARLSAEPYAPSWIPKPDLERLAFDDILHHAGVNMLGTVGGGVFGAGAELEGREGTAEDLYAHLMARVKESYDKGVADGREALLKEQATRADT